MDISGAVVLDVPKSDVNGVAYNQRDWIIADKCVQIVSAMTPRQLSDTVAETEYQLECYKLLEEYSKSHTDEYDQDYYALFTTVSIRRNIDWSTVRRIVGDFFDATNIFKDVSLQNLSRQFDKYRLYVEADEYDTYYKYYHDVVGNRHLHKSHRSYTSAYPHKRWLQIIDFMRMRWMNQEAIRLKRIKTKKALDKLEVEEAKLKVVSKQDWRKFVSELK